MKKIFAAMLCLISYSGYSATPTCHELTPENYCKYTGKVARIYVNQGKLILMYFDSPVDPSVPQSFGINASRGNAGAISIDNHPEFANYFYSTALAAQASGRDVSVQMRGTEAGYMKIDRIWLYAP